MLTSPPIPRTSGDRKSPRRVEDVPESKSLGRAVPGILAREWKTFTQVPSAMRVLLTANGIYALVLPVIEIFVAASILRRSRSSAMVVLCQLVIYAATPVGFAVNGILLRRISASRLYASGMILTGIALFCLLLPAASSPMGSFASAALLGIASGLFWANRGFLVLACTHDRDRNYYYGVETSIITLTSVLVPIAVAWLFTRTGTTGASPESARGQYGLLAAASLIVATLAAVVIGRRSIPIQPHRRFLFLRSHPVWRRMLSLAVLKAVAQGYIVTAPAMLIFRFVGHERTLGVIEAIGGCVAAACLYFLGRICGPEHRVTIFSAGQLAFLGGSIASTIAFNKTGVLVFMACLLVAKPLIDLGYYPIQFKMTNLAAELERRNDYSYIMSHECATFLGRFVGCGIFLGITMFFSQNAALRYALPIIGALQLPAISLARRLVTPAVSTPLAPRRPTS